VSVEAEGVMKTMKTLRKPRRARTLQRKSGHVYANSGGTARIRVPYEGRGLLL